MSEKERLNRILLIFREQVNLRALAHLVEMLSGKVHITFLHVLEFPPTTPIDEGTVTPLVNEAKRKFMDLIEWAKSQNIEADLRVVASRDMYEAALVELDRSDYDIVALQWKTMGTRKRFWGVFTRGGPFKLIEGSKHVVVILPQF